MKLFINRAILAFILLTPSLGRAGDIDVSFLPEDKEPIEVSGDLDLSFSGDIDLAFTATSENAVRAFKGVVDEIVKSCSGDLPAILKSTISREEEQVTFSLHLGVDGTTTIVTTMRDGTRVLWKKPELSLE